MVMFINVFQQLIHAQRTSKLFPRSDVQKRCFSVMRSGSSSPGLRVNQFGQLFASERVAGRHLVDKVSFEKLLAVVLILIKVEVHLADKKIGFRSLVSLDRPNSLSPSGSG